jgi:hypothetical protein
MGVGERASYAATLKGHTTRGVVWGDVIAKMRSKRKVKSDDNNNHAS